MGDVCRKISWSCIIEDSTLFLRHFLEKFTNRSKQVKILFLIVIENMYKKACIKIYKLYTLEKLFSQKFEYKIYLNF